MGIKPGRYVQVEVATGLQVEFLDFVAIEKRTFVVHEEDLTPLRLAEIVEAVRVLGESIQPKEAVASR